MPANGHSGHRAAPFAAMGRSYKSFNPTVGAGHAREKDFAAGLWF